MRIKYTTAVPIVLLLTTGMCGHPNSARARSHRTHLQPVQANTHVGPLKSDIKVYLDGKELPTVSTYDGQPCAPIIVDGQLLIPIRFVQGQLAKDLFLDKGWGIIQLRAGLLLKIGSTEWHTTTDSSTDSLNMSIGRLATAPREIGARLYMPVDPMVFRFLQLTTNWNPEKRELRFTPRK